MNAKGEGNKQATSDPTTGRAEKPWLWITGGVITVIVVALAYSLFARDLVGGDATSNAYLAPDLTLATADGQVRLSDLRGQPLLLYFSFPG